MSIVKNIHLLTDISDNEKSMIEYAGRAHIQFGGIYFTIIEYSLDRVVIKIVQGKSPFEIYHAKERLVQIVHETFGRFFTHKEIIVNPIVFQQSKVNQVDTKWVKEKMKETGIRLNRIADDLGMDFSELQSILSNTRSKPLSQIMKACLYYYFESKTVNKY